tara:strand:+ start:2224 stop:2466 length:243 start_codon:yes stop_codon:yes gene_type:complete
MNTLKELLESNSKSMFYYWGIFINRFYTWFEEPKPVNHKDWVGIKLKNSVFPAFYPKNNRNNVFLYLEVWNDKNKIWKRN